MLGSTSKTLNLFLIFMKTSMSSCPRVRQGYSGLRRCRGDEAVQTGRAMFAMLGRSPVIGQHQSVTGAPVMIYNVPFPDLAPGALQGLASANPTITAWTPAVGYNDPFAGRHWGNVCTFDGTPIFSASGLQWITACTGRELTVAHYPISEAPRWLDSADPPSPLPDQNHLYVEIQKYQASEFSLFFPILDPSLVTHTIQAAYYGQISTGSPCLSCARAAIFAFHSLALSVVHGDEDGALESSVRYAREAYRLVPEIIKGAATLDGLQAVLMLGLAADFSTIDHLLTTVARLIYQLRLNLSPDHAGATPLAVNIHARRLFRIAYVCDKGLTLLTGLPPRLEDSICDPAPSLFENSNDPASTTNAYLDAYDLEKWKDSLPLPNRPTLIPAEHDLVLQNTDMRFSVFHLQYHHCLLMIHQASSRCASWIGNQDTQNTSSSLAISVTASRAFLRTFVFHRVELGPQNLLFCLTYFIQTAINLFCNVLSHPLHPETNEDMNLMGLISDLIAAKKRARDPVCYVGKITFAQEFILELKRLARCAVDRATAARQASVAYVHELHPAMIPVMERGS
ncbi:C6 zinc finger domain protein [Aspergillus costaricaensis CBS 115574]|uniref:C6 zinc finger domain protein n=1 Tax=Aspergillus costaricaensis CBS 115574 TaxID=1448317 RepID=A0ACD1I2C5_9EURO|nr:C6 zinc finger domain protein [Aspergillus costaricaensis CBS 115574]RAK84507.1 C6 zinc finger domain protein [Aspergillus costaricaensis CBS 115574]